MALHCTICTHARRTEIDKALVHGTALRQIAESFGASEAALHRHKHAHLPTLLTEAKQADDKARAATLTGQVQHQETARQEHALDVVAQLKAINGASLAILSEARRAQEPETALKAIDRIAKQIELQARLIGQLDERPTVNVTVSAEWIVIRTAILSVLGAYPDARVAVAERLAALEVGHAGR